MQKWEYAFIYHSYGNAPDVVLSYLHPAGENRLTLEKGRGPGIFKPGDYWGQIKTWMVKLGQEGYEMTGVSATDYAGGGVSQYWFKRPIQ